MCRPGTRVIPLGGRTTCITSRPRSPVGAVRCGSRRRRARNSGRATPSLRHEPGVALSSWSTLHFHPVRRAALWAEQSPFDLKDVLKRRGYRWSDGSPDPGTSTSARRLSTTRSLSSRRRSTCARSPSPADVDRLYPFFTVGIETCPRVLHRGRGTVVMRRTRNQGGEVVQADRGRASERRSHPYEFYGLF
ncbi:hypothetical protein ABH972_008083 [Bradyrhizobium ottawaense]